MESEPFLDVPKLLESSLPVRRPPWLWYLTGLFLLVLVGSALLGSSSGQVDALLNCLSVAMVLGLVLASSALVMGQARGQQQERQQLETIEEMVQLRRWPEAAGLLTATLSRPMRSPAHRAQALIYLASALARYHRFADAIHVQEELLDHVLLDEPTAHGLRLGRVMALLRDDRLFDADRAINELRRQSGAEESGGLALIEIYRDVKTGHPAEAVAMFEQRLPQMRQQLGHRVGDAYILAAKGYDLLQRQSEAQQAYQNATLLGPLVEYHRRYPEVQALAEKYPPVPLPPELESPIGMSVAQPNTVTPG